MLDELGLVYHPPTDPTAAKWALAYWRIAQIVDGTLEPTIGADMIWVDAAFDLDYPDRLQPIVDWAILLADRSEDRDISIDEIRSSILQDARDLLNNQPPSAQNM